jgi:hypothetical protein
MRNLICLLALIFILNFPTVGLAEEVLPPGFIAFSKTKLSFTDAQKFCEEHDGRLPLIAGLASAQGSPPGRIPIDGFGFSSGPWPEGLPKELFWTGSEGSNGPFVIMFFRNGVYAMSSPTEYAERWEDVVCVPK